MIFSHSSCSQLCGHPPVMFPTTSCDCSRTTAGVIMIAFVPMFLSAEYNEWFKGGRVGPRPAMTVDHLADHVEHARDVAGIDHIGLGSDYDGFDDFPDGMQDVSGFAVLIDRLAERGWSAEDLAKLMGNNVLRVLDETSAASMSSLS